MDQRIFAPTHGLSQLITSFIASVSQGIRHAPLTTFANELISQFAHTISCNFEIITQFLKTKSSLLTVLCVNMSKISVRIPRLRRFRYRVEVRIDCAYAASILSHLSGE